VVRAGKRESPTLRALAPPASGYPEPPSDLPRRAAAGRRAGVRPAGGHLAELDGTAQAEFGWSRGAHDEHRGV